MTTAVVVAAAAAAAAAACAIYGRRSSLLKRIRVRVDTFERPRNLQLALYREPRARA